MRLHFIVGGGIFIPLVVNPSPQACRVKDLSPARVKGAKFYPDLFKEGFLSPLPSPHYRGGLGLSENTGGGLFGPPG